MTKNYYLVWPSNRVGKFGVNCLFKLTSNQLDYLRKHPPVDDAKLTFFEGRNALEAIKRSNSTA